MALIPCPHRGKKISDKASRCPGCGTPIANQPSEPKIPSAPLYTPSPQDSGLSSPPQRQSRVGLWVGLGVGFVAIAAILAVLFIVRPFNGIDNDLRKSEPGESSEVTQLRKKAYRGDVESQKELALCYINGEGVETDITKGYRWTAIAAERGNAEAQYVMGCFYEEGVCVDQSDEEAFRWYLQAADQFLPEAQLEVGKAYLFNKGVEADDSQAVSWLRKAANQELDEAQLLLGQCYMYGVGVDRDLDEAENWLQKAADQDNTDAIELLKELKLLDLYDKIDYFIDELSYNVNSYDWTLAEYYAKYACDGQYRVMPIGRLINIRIEQVVPSYRYTELCNRLKDHYNNNSNVRNVYVCQGGTVMIDCFD